jgi:hypothetical protein
VYMGLLPRGGSAGGVRGGDLRGGHPYDFRAVPLVAHTSYVVIYPPEKEGMPDGVFVRLAGALEHQLSGGKGSSLVVQGCGGAGHLSCGAWRCQKRVGGAQGPADPLDVVAYRPELTGKSAQKAPLSVCVVPHAEVRHELTVGYVPPRPRAMGRRNT